MGAAVLVFREGIGRFDWQGSTLGQAGARRYASKLAEEVGQVRTGDNQWDATAPAVETLQILSWVNEQSGAHHSASDHSNNIQEKGNLRNMNGIQSAKNAHACKCLFMYIVLLCSSPIFSNAELSFRPAATFSVPNQMEPKSLPPLRLRVSQNAVRILRMSLHANSI